MKLKITYLLVILLSSLEGYSQDQTAHLNLILFIDDEIVKTGIYDGVFQTKDSLGNVADSITFRYQVGELILTLEGYRKLTVLKPESKVVIAFKYRQICPNVIEYEYSKEIPLSWLFQRYVIFKVYNFTNKKNRKDFREKKGYGFEIETPERSMLIPRKKISRTIINCN